MERVCGNILIIDEERTIGSKITADENTRTFQLWDRYLNCGIN